MRKEFTMTDDQYSKLMEAMRPVPMIMLQCGPPTSQQELANRAWKSLANELGFVWDTAEPCGKGDKVFSAEAKP